MYAKFKIKHFYCVEDKGLKCFCAHKSRHRHNCTYTYILYGNNERKNDKFCSESYIIRKKILQDHN